MENDREKSRDQNEGSGQQQAIDQNQGQPPEDQQSQQQAGRQPTGQESDKGDTATLNSSNPSERADQSQQETGGFVGSQNEDSGEYLQQDGNPQSGFPEQGSGASNASEDMERDSERSQNRDSDIEGSSGNS